MRTATPLLSLAEGVKAELFQSNRQGQF